MKKIYTLVFLLSIGISNLLAATMEEANQAYTDGDYAKAASYYETIASQTGVSSELYYNLGNAYYKQGEYALAILNYERALRMMPDNEDAQYNLSLAQARIVDKIEVIEPFFLNRWFVSVRNLFASNQWAIVGVVSFLLLITAVALYLFVRKVAIRKIAFFSGLILVVIVIFSNIFASELKTAYTKQDAAIVIAPTVTLKSTPADSGTDLFILHEGTKVYIQSRLGDWAEIRLEDGNKGWMPSGKMAII